MRERSAACLALPPLRDHYAHLLISSSLFLTVSLPHHLFPPITPPPSPLTPHQVLGSMELIDEGETDHKIIVLREDDPNFDSVHSMADLERVKVTPIEAPI